MTTFKSGDDIQYFRSHDNTWQPGKYVGSTDGINHAVKTTYGKIITVGPNRCRTRPTRQSLAGSLIIYTSSNGQKISVGPLMDEHAVKRAIEERVRIYPDGPDAVLDLTRYDITYELGDGLTKQEPAA